MIIKNKKIIIWKFMKTHTHKIKTEINNKTTKIFKIKYNIKIQYIQNE